MASTCQAAANIDGGFFAGDVELMSAEGHHAG
jgi:hypothetical protein